MSLWAFETAKAAASRTKRSHTLHWLSHLGLPGMFLVALIDSSPIPLPIPGTTDLLLLWLTAHKSANPIVLVVCTLAGSVIGGFLSWHVGRKGGEMALERRVPRRLLERVRRWVKSNPLLSVFVPALLPPPIPLSPFVLGAGALGVPLRRFLIAFAAARAVRYSLVAWLGATYGRHVIGAWTGALQKWATPIIVGFVLLFAAGIAISIVRARRNPRPAASPVRESAAD